MDQENKNLPAEEIPGFSDSITMIDGKPWISSVDVAERLQKRHDNLLGVIKRISESNKECSAFYRPTTRVTDRNKEYPCYFINRDGLTLLLMKLGGQQSTEWNIRYIKAFNQIEENLKKLAVDSWMVDDKIERAKLWIKEEEHRQMLVKEVEALKPKAEAFTAICNGNNARSFTEASKLLGIKRTDLIRALEVHEYVYRNIRGNIVAYAKYAEETGNGIFKLKETVTGSYKNKENKKCFTTAVQTLVTQAGMNKLRNLLRRWGVLKTA